MASITSHLLPVLLGLAGTALPAAEPWAYSGPAQLILGGPDLPAPPRPEAPPTVTETANADQQAVVLTFTVITRPIPQTPHTVDMDVQRLVNKLSARDHEVMGPSVIPAKGGPATWHNLCAFGSYTAGYTQTDAGWQPVKQRYRLGHHCAAAIDPNPRHFISVKNLAFREWTVEDVGERKGQAADGTTRAWSAPVVIQRTTDARASVPMTISDGGQIILPLVVTRCQGTPAGVVDRSPPEEDAWLLVRFEIMSDEPPAGRF